MTDNKSNTAPNRASGSRNPRAGANRQQQGGGGRAQGQRAVRAGTIDDAINKAMTGRVNVTPAKAIEMAGQLYNRGQYGPAVRVCRQVIEARPGNSDAHNILGVSLAAAGNTDGAIESLKRAIKINPNAPSYHANLGEVLRKAKQTAEAEEVLKEAVRLDPNSPQALNNLGITQYELRKYSEAVD
jgi:Flp pilus assembly protein TadD